MFQQFVFYVVKFVRFENQFFSGAKLRQILIINQINLDFYAKPRKRLQFLRTKRPFVRMLIPG